MTTYPSPMVTVLFIIKKSTYTCLLSALLFITCAPKGFSQELVFKKPSLETERTTAGKDGAVYRFPGVTNNVDALVKIIGRSSSKVKLVDIDLTSSGFDNAFQPQVTFNNGTTPGGKSDWYMEFDISFVKSATSMPVNVTKMDVTALDVDGNGDGLREYVTFYGLKSYTLEARTQITVTSVLDNLLGIVGSVAGKKFLAPTTNYPDIDPTATRVMVTNKYENVKSFRVRTGGVSDGENGAADRMYSLWFKSFTYQAPVDGSLPVKLTSFNATRKADSKVGLSWTTAQEENVSHFVIERSVDGSNYTEVGMVFAFGNSNTTREYNFTDDLKNNSNGIIYYRLRMVDMDGRMNNSMVRLIRTGGDKGTASISAYPNPVVNELRVTLPAAWQDKSVTIDIYNNNGQVVKRSMAAKANQTEIVNMSDIGTGLYIVRVSNGSESAVQKITKAK